MANAMIMKQSYLTFVISIIIFSIKINSITSFSKRFHTSYGWLSFWDWFYGTDSEFMKTKAHKKRHIRLHTIKSARELFPDED